MGARHVIAFGSAALQAALSVHFFMAFVHKIYIEGVALDRSHIGELLTSSLYLARHSSVVVMGFASRKPIQRSPGYLQIDHYTWTHKTIRPWGSDMPLQCSTCGSLASLQARTTNGGVVEAKCSRSACGHSLRFEQPHEWVPLLILALVPAGRVWGLDRRLSRRRPRWPF